VIEAPGAWEPGMPSVRAIGPSAVGGAIVPLAVYFAVRHHVSGDATALMIAGVPAIAWIVVQWIRTRALDPVGAITLYGFAVGVIASVALGGNAYVLKVRETAFGIPFAIGCLWSVRYARRPVMFHIGKVMSAGADERRQAAYDELYELPTAPETFARITVVWGIAILLHAGCTLVLAAFVTTGQYLAIAPPFAALYFGALFVFTLRYSQRARRRGEALLIERGLEYPSVPDAVGG
jgi:hypothetical protein